MGLFAFIKNAGEKLFGKGEAQAAAAAVAADPTPVNLEALSAAAGQAVVDYVHTMNLDADALSVAFDATSGQATVSGVARSQNDMEKIVLCCGNVAGVESVVNNMTVDEPADESEFYTVVSGDTLSKISKEFYDTPNKYQAIFEANQPMLSHPDKIYPGQVLRIPAEA
jgi:nucleoid-associated protein YgaU